MEKTDEILERLKDWQPVIDNPDELTESIMARLPESAARGSHWRLVLGRSLKYASLIAAAVLVAVVTLFTWKSFKPEDQPQLAEKAMELVPLEDTPKVVEINDVPSEPTTHMKLANDTRVVGQSDEPRPKVSRPARKDNKAAKETNIHAEKPVPAEAKPQQEEEVPIIPADKQALADIFLAEEALQVAYELRAQQEAIRAYTISFTDEEPAKPTIAF